jgi:hypothetical protein
MADSKPIRLSEPTVWIFKYLAPLTIAFVATGYFWSKADIIVPILLVVAGLLYWAFRFLPLKEVKLDNDVLIITNDFKTDRVHLNDIVSIEIEGKRPPFIQSRLLFFRSTFLTRLHFKRQTKFGQTITFATMTAGFGGGISDRVNNILTQIQDNIDRQTK